MSKRPITLNYIVFYILFLPDTYQIMIGIIATVLITPFVLKPEMKLPGQIILYIMVATIGYAASRKLGQWISEGFKKLILGDKRPGSGS